MIKKTIIAQPVTYEEAYKHLKLEPGEDEGLVNRLVRASTQLAENYIEKSIAKTENIVALKSLYGNYIRVTEWNFLGMVTIKVADEELSGGFSVIAYQDHFIITLDTPLNGYDVEIKYHSGYLPTDCPEDIKQAILLKVGELYDMDRSGYVTQTYRSTGTFEAILNFHKPIRFR